MKKRTSKTKIVFIFHSFPLIPFYFPKNIQIQAKPHFFSNFFFLLKLFQKRYFVEFSIFPLNLFRNKTPKIIKQPKTPNSKNPPIFQMSYQAYKYDVPGGSGQYTSYSYSSSSNTGTGGAHGGASYSSPSYGGTT